MSRLGYFVRETLISLRRNLMMTVAGILTVAVSLALLGGALLFKRTVDHGFERILKGVEFVVFVNVDVGATELADLDEAMIAAKQAGLVDDYEYLDEAAAYQDFRETFRNQPDVAGALEEGEVPTSYQGTLTNPNALEVFVEEFTGRPGVLDVKTPNEAAKGMRTADRWVRVILIVLAVALAVSALFLIVNTIRLATYARRREIEVMKLVGASNWFVRIPFMAEGLVQGAVGAGMAFGVVQVFQRVLSKALDRSDNLFQTFYITSSDALGIGSFILLLGAIIGLAGSLLGLRRFLDV
jgi:cell division transport system permease protein